MTLSTSLAAVFLRHYTWKNSAPWKLDIEPLVHARVSRRAARSVSHVHGGGCTRVASGEARCNIRTSERDETNRRIGAIRVIQFRYNPVKLITKNISAFIYRICADTSFVGDLCSARSTQCVCMYMDTYLPIDRIDTI